MQPVNDSQRNNKRTKDAKKENKATGISVRRTEIRADPPNKLLEKSLCLKPIDNPEGGFSTRFEIVRNPGLGDFFEELGSAPGPTDDLDALLIRQICADGHLERV